MELGKAVPKAILAVAAAVFLGLVARAWPFTTDDSFITFRYASHLAAGFGPTWNPGAPHAEGYTTFLWMVVMTAPSLLRLDPLVASKILGVLAILATLVVVYKFVRRLSERLPEPRRSLAASLGVLMLASQGATAIHAVSGMETALYTLSPRCLSSWCSPRWVWRACCTGSVLRRPH